MKLTNQAPYLFNYMLAMSILLSCSQAPTSQTESRDSKPSPEESMDVLMEQDEDIFLNISFKKHLSEVGIPLSSPIQNEYESLQPGNLYSNQYFNLTIDLPNDWDVDRGISEYTIIRAYQADLGLTIHLNVQPLLDKFDRMDGTNPNTISYWNSLHNGDYKASMTHLLKSQGGIEAEDLTLTEIKIGTNDFVVTTYRNKQYYEDEPYYMKTSTYQSIMFNTTYTVSYSAPDILFDTLLIINVLNRFKVLNPKLGNSPKERNER